jgi:HSP20 family protein
MLACWDPLFEIDPLRYSVFACTWPEARTEFEPAVDVFEDDKAIHVKADLPGVKADEIKIELNKNVLTLRGERKAEKEDKTDDGCYLAERDFGTFSRSFTLPDGVESEAIAAKYTEGVLEVTLPKSAELKPREIKVLTS